MTRREATFVLRAWNENRLDRSTAADLDRRTKHACAVSMPSQTRNDVKTHVAARFEQLLC
jgi:hypothetical protein